jgi:flagellin
MSLVVRTNVEAFDAHRNLVSTENALAQSMQRLSSGYRINSAADDAAGLSISERLEGQIGGLDQAQRNISDGISLVQTAEGSLTQVQAMLQRIRDLAVQYQNGTLSTTDQQAIQSEVNQLSSEIERIGESAQFNGISLLSQTSTVSFQVGANDGQQISVALISLGSTVNTAAFSLASSSAVSQIDAAINSVSAADAAFGAVENRLQYSLDNASIYEENLTSSDSRIKDVDMASEMVNFTKLQILQQAGTSMLAQANQSSSSVLKLLQ